MAQVDIDPLFGPPGLKRIELRKAPLTGVVVQLRFGEIFLIQNREFVASFQERIRAAYPLPQEEKNLSVQIADGTPAIKTSTTWKFADANDDWKVSLAPDFMALETSAYTSRADLRMRLTEILAALNETIKPTLVTRLGVRFVNRIVSPQLEQLHEMVRPELASFSASKLRDHIQRSLTEAVCEAAEGKMLLRWGLMPPRVSHDLNLLPPINERGWVLDLDAFREYQPPQAFDVDAVAETAQALATRINTFFYWAAQKKLVEVFEGEG